MMNDFLRARVANSRCTTNHILLLIVCCVLRFYICVVVDNFEENLVHRWNLLLERLDFDLRGDMREQLRVGHAVVGFAQAILCAVFSL